MGTETVGAGRLTDLQEDHTGSPFHIAMVTEHHSTPPIWVFSVPDSFHISAASVDLDMETDLDLCLLEKEQALATMTRWFLIVG